MANNLLANKSHCVIAKTSTSIAAAGLDATNISRIFQVGDVFRSYVPGRSINAFTQLEAGKAYWIDVLVDMDKESYFMPPLTGGAPPPDTNYITGYTPIEYNTLTGITETDGVYAGGVGNGYAGGILFTSGQQGRFAHKYMADTNTVAFGWNGNGAQNGFGDIFATAWVDNGSLSAWTSNAPVASNVATLAVGDYVGILREFNGSDHVYKLQVSTDGGSTWTTVWTYAWNGGGGNWAPGVYHQTSSGKHYYPQYIRL